MDLGKITGHLTSLAGGGSKEPEYPMEDMSLFYTLLSAHFICAIFLYGEKMVSTYHNFPVLHGFFTNMISTCFYTLVIIYCIYKERMLVNEPYQDDPICDSMVEGWLRFEIRIMLMWLSACAIFLLYAQCFRFKSRWKSIEE